MAAERVITFLFILVLVAALISFAQANQGSNHKTAPTGKELVNGADELAANENWVIGGRKLMVQTKKVKMSGGVGLGGSTAIVNLSDEVDGHQSSFETLNADYHAPRHPPPKNN
ncbi:Tetratricopeptide repeat-like superfamily protein, putative isoform 1 [Hibiscus syriacus]|uniref:Tetratricopeptide repeat-like superfamily protein, putative isoform 1 n=1 Tax=Hibiscus syriacus TaxID=106335 RepID=A0A6A3B510_HIBSY|nr:uncharacterized protein LOC120118225 [Hibiscus syriacus]KAE8710149.1 Tetratricopeptide repeat-like superfamily protein, putative isoform 1 [Hibiscus syriacus]